MGPLSSDWSREARCVRAHGCDIALLGTVTATLASWLVEAVAAEKQESEDIRATFHRLESRVEDLGPGTASSTSESTEKSSESGVAQP